MKEDVVTNNPLALLMALIMCVASVSFVETIASYTPKSMSA